MTSAGLSCSTASTGPGLREGPLTWGQQEVWAGFAAAYPHDVLHTFCRVVELPAALRPVDREHVAAAMDGLLERHEGFRSRVVERPDGLGTQVGAPGRITIAEVVAEPGAESAAAHRLAADLRAQRFDYAGEWPLRVGVVRCGSAVSHVVLAFCHIAADGLASDLVIRDLLTLLRGRRPFGAVLQPLDLAEWQRSPAGRAVADAAARYWYEAYAQLPESMFGVARGAAAAANVFEVSMVSSALPMALAELARRRRVSTNTVLMAATALLVGGQTGREVTGLAPTVGNRIRPENAELVTTVAQNSVFWLDVGTSHGAEQLLALLPHARSAALRAYRWAYHDPADRRAHDDPTFLHPHSGFNDLRAPDRPSAALDLSAVRRAMAATTLRSSVPEERLSCRFYVRLTDEPDGLGLEVRGDQNWVPSSFVADFGPGLEELVVAAAVAAG